MDIGAKRVFRLSLTTSITLAVAYGMALDMPYIAPLFAFMLSAAPKPPMGLKGLVGLALVLTLTLSIGLLLTPILNNYATTGLMLVLLALFFCNYLSLNLGKAMIGTLLTIGVTMVPAAGMMGLSVASALIDALVVGAVLGVLCQWLVYPLFPEDGPPAAPPPPPPPSQSSWLALRASLIIFPSFLLGLINPAAYLPLIMKSVSLGQQASFIDARSAGRELLGSTFMGGLFAVLFWMGLSINPNLWMFFLWMLLFMIFVSSKFYGVLESRYPPSFWQNVVITLLILLGPAVADSASGKDVYKAFAVRMGLFIAVTLYAWAAVVVLDHIYHRKKQRQSMPKQPMALTKR